jgi:hypothetical protein
MVKFQQERLSVGLIDEITPMLEDHYEELTRHKERVKLAPRWGAYFALADADKLVIYTARDDAGTLVGYSWWLVDYHLHYAALLVAFNDVFYLTPAQRRGPTALRFLRYTQQQLVARGVDKIAYHVKAVNNLGPILQRLGYTPEEGVVAFLT